MFTFTRKRIYTLGVVITLLLYIGIEWYDFSKKNILNYPLIFEVHKGDTIHSVSRRLRLYNTAVKPNIFEIMAKVKGVKSIYAGEYEITPTTTSLDLLNKFDHRQIYLRRFTIVEGWRVQLLLTQIEQCLYLKNDITGLSQDQLLEKIGIKHKHLEGLFLPETYSFAKNTLVSTILIDAHSDLKNKLDEEWKNRDLDLPYENSYQALIAASLIEKETALDNERELIAAVIASRLKKNMYLQIDPTVIYGMGDKYKGILTREDLKIDTEYNTYKRKGLPPTPIGLPRLSSIHAALHPAKTDVLYFVASRNGGHIFTNNLKDHLASVEKLKKFRLEEKK